MVEAKVSITERIHNSNFLSSLQHKYPELAIVDEHTPSAKACSEQLNNLCDELSTVDASDYSAVQEVLIRSKAKFSYYWAVCEFCQYGEYDERGGWQTRFAESSISLGLKACWYQICAKHKQLEAVVRQHQGELPGLFIIGMGKLGGRDLNFSSDVDLIAYFDPVGLPIPETLGKSYICHQMLQGLTQLLGQKGSADFIWRVDWRLRPNASATTLAMSISAAEDYYYYRASPWHRLALMKARVVAGDIETGQRFLNTITPFIWRQNLDFRALDELGEIKNRINLEHPGLKAQRLWRDPISDDISGFNVKLGTGGIREIEFIANALQLVWGGKHYRLRTANTLKALAGLAELNLLSAEVANQLADCYRYLRGIENGIQLMANLQTHLIPLEPLSQQKLLIVLGLQSWEALVQETNKRRNIVSQHFEALFAEQADADMGDILWPENLSVPASEVVEAWEAGFVNYGVSNQLRARLKPLAHALATYLESAVEGHAVDLKASDIILRLHQFFRSLPQGEQYFRLLAGSPKLLESIIEPLLYSPPMTTLLQQSPHIVDNFVAAPLIDEQMSKFDSDFVTQADQYEIRLERTRRFVNENLYRLYLRFLQGDIAVSAFQLQLSQLAEHTLTLCLNIVAENMQLDSVPIAVIGMGKVGLQCMAPMSDLDLIFIFDPDHCSLDLASRYVSRLQTAISAPMREGVVYELDTRLRPSGKSGAPTVSIESFAAHQLERAHTWEHIALVPSRVVYGEASLVAKIEHVKREVMTRRRDPHQLRLDAQTMWARITEHRVKGFDQSVMFSKLRAGGLMQSEYFAACSILSSEQLGDSMAFDKMLSLSSQNSQWPELASSIQFWRIQQLWERLLGFTEQPLESLPSAYQQRLLEHSQAGSVDELISKKQHHADSVTNAMQTWLNLSSADEEQLSSWQESAVRWI